MARRDLIVIGASAGGIEALLALLPLLPRDFPAAVAVTVHLSTGSKTALPAIISRHGEMPATQAKHGERLRTGHIYFAPPDAHFEVARGPRATLTAVLHAGPRENRARPAIDPLFRTAARAGGTRVAGVLLSGALEDGVAGLISVQRSGGKVLVQSPETAVMPQMPRAALEHLTPDFVGAPASIAAHLEEIAGQTVKPLPNKRERRLISRPLKRPPPEGKPSMFACPECHGTLWELEDKSLLEFRCRVGHAYTAATLLEEEDLAVEAALWAAIRALEESEQLSQRLADRARASKQLHTAARFAERAQEQLHQSSVLHGLLQRAMRT